MGYWFTTAPQYLQRRALHRQHAQREPHSRRARSRRRREDRQGAVALQHDSAGREGSGLGRRRADLGRRRAKRRRHLGNGGDRSRARSALRRRSAIRSATARSARARISSRDSIDRADARYREVEVVLPADASRCLGLRLGRAADALRHDTSAAGASRRWRRPARTATSTSSNRETGQPVHPIKEMPVPTDDRGPASMPWPTQPIPFTAAGKPMEPVCPIVRARHSRRAPGGGQQAVPHFTPPGPGSMMRAGHRRRHELQPDCLQPADRLAVCRGDRQPFNVGPRPRRQRLLLRLRPDDRRD